ncbi:lytic transglycosylase domain-containing protein [Mesorhizobium sp. M7A.F.Ca.US.006.04.2.1]|uniref:lytic transglycosylase domain-containing protein n=1 Tax=unclassified Mesorhizobium TaxID=325217 RepID=UPI000FCA64BA|nr:MULTISPECIES: transglycosylase SLT domain-containing protein [unclassified Mesorhizobium]RUX73283.1 lytic transglycosylase domain-containing protein [Mesorhizobium sp. M7A.F.Ca.US.005.03.1.1]RUY13733.1 lytic transglycosylase domain-containing protein [Mesorhizobium sp. M7A.F.Ca.US.005.03.2.1]RUY30501.1 lytic transglycosylase domain-containing protein [Mesorhizobium sp. M7A.F.Ca.US.001.04.2.1]RUY45342.1 lytic transglycosylase domain-containing protein [Mesorhizobium sp. M7A.F.Ca.US.001.04.1.1
MTADGSFLKAVAGAIVLFGFVQTVTPASANWLERPSVKPQLSSGLKQPVRCDPATEWTRQAFKAFASCQASIYGLEPMLAHAVMEIESGFDPDVQGGDGEVGLMQVMPATARMLGFRGSLDDLSAPAANIALGVKYLAQANKLAAGDLCTTVMKYRAGHNESRFSALSVRYCQRARAILAREGIEVTGPLPVATFGFSAFSPGEEGGAPAQAKGVCVRRVFVPGPRYMKCADYRSAGQARQIRALRGRLFGG